MVETPGKMYALATVLTLLAILAIILRFWARRVKKVRPSWDDYLIVLALISTIGTGVCMVVGAAIGSLGRHEQVTSEGMPVFNARVEVLLKIIYISQLTQTTTFGLTKAAVILFYRRIFTSRTFSIISWVMISLTTAWTITFFAANLLQCLPISAQWNGWFTTPGTCIQTNVMYLAQAWSDVLTDIMILAMPLPGMWKLQMAPMRKFCVILMFQLGALVICAGVAKLVVFYRIVYELDNGDRDLTYLLTPTLYWPMVESSLGIVGACLPLLRPIFTDTSPKSIFSSLRTMISPSSFRNSDASELSREYIHLEAGKVWTGQNRGNVSTEIRSARSTLSTLPSISPQ